MVIKIASDMKKEIFEVADIHHKELPASIMTHMGLDFLANIYYPACIDSPNFHCFAYTYEGRVIGFTSISNGSDTGGLILLLFKYPLKLLVYMATLPFKNFKGFCLTVRTVYHMLFAPKEPLHDVPCEQVSTAILLEFRSLEFFKRTNIRVSRELYMHMLKFLLDNNIEKIKGFSVESDIFVNANVRNLGYEKRFAGLIPNRNPIHRLVGYTWDVKSAAKKFGLVPST